MFQVKLDVKLAAGFSAGKLTVEEARNSNARWIVLDWYHTLYTFDLISTFELGK